METEYTVESWMDAMSMSGRMLDKLGRQVEEQMMDKWMERQILDRYLERWTSEWIDGG